MVWMKCRTLSTRTCSKKPWRLTPSMVEWNPSWALAESGWRLQKVGRWPPKPSPFMGNIWVYHGECMRITWLTCAKRREFLGMIQWLTINFNNPSNPQQPIHSLRLAPVRKWVWMLVTLVTVSIRKNWRSPPSFDRWVVCWQGNISFKTYRMT